MKRFFPLALAGFALLAAGNASAAIVANLVFTQPTGTVLDTDSIPVYITLTLDPSSDPLTSDALGNVTSLTAAAIDANLLPGVAAIPASSADMTNSNFNSSFECSGTFITGCDGPPYDFIFSSDFLNTPNFSLAAGDSVTLLFGTFAPTGGVAPAGSYVFHHANLFIQVFDNTRPDSVRDPLATGSILHLADVPIASTTSDFTRDVLSSAPEPGTIGLLIGGLIAVALRAKKRTR